MSLDGFEQSDAQAFGDSSPELAAAFSRAVERAARWLAIDVRGVESLPSGPALLVANHAFGWDIAFAMEEIHRATGRRVFALGEHMWWRLPYLRRVAAAVGVVDGTPENIDRLLKAGELVLVLPGGMREAVKPRALRYRLLWGERYGFVRAAIRNQVPLVPIAAFGADELFDWVGDAEMRGRRWLGPVGLGWLPLPRPAWFVPWPHRVQLRYVIGEPLRPLFGREAEHERHALRTTRLLVEGALHELIDLELARRAHISVAPRRA